MTAWICAGVPAVMFESVHTTSFRIDAFDSFNIKLFNLMISNTIAPKKSEGYHRQSPSSDNNARLGVRAGDNISDGSKGWILYSEVMMTDENKG